MPTSKVRSERNVFEDLGFTPGEAAVLAMRIDLTLIIESYIRRKHLTQVAAARHFGVTQPEISRILRRRFEEISLEKLVRLAAMTGRTPRVTFKSRGRAEGQGLASTTAPAKQTRQTPPAPSA